MTQEEIARDEALHADQLALTRDASRGLIVFGDVEHRYSDVEKTPPKRRLRSKKQLRLATTTQAIAAAAALAKEMGLSGRRCVNAGARSIKVKVVRMGETMRFESVKDAAKALGVSEFSASALLNGRRRHRRLEAEGVRIEREV